MPAYNFQPRFAPQILSGEKRTTIRSKPAKAGSPAHLFTGMRTKTCQRLGQSVVTDCLSVTLGWLDNGSPHITLGSRRLNHQQQISMAEADGFESPREMGKWFETTYKVPVNHSGCAHDVFAGFWIKWEPL